MDRSKDNPRDAFTISKLLHTSKYTETRLLRGEYVELYDRLRRDIRRQKVLISKLAGQLFPELTSVFKDFAGATASAMLRNHAAAAVVRQMSLETFIAAVRADFRARRLQVAKLRLAHRQAARSVGVVDGIQALQLALRLHIETRKRLESQLEEAHAALTDTLLTFRLILDSFSIVCFARIAIPTARPSDARFHPRGYAP